MSCLICLAALTGAEAAQRYHGRCLQALFRTSALPAIPFGLDEVPAVVARTAEKLSGFQLKVSAALVDGTLVPTEGGRYLIKPPVRRSHVPENEHLTMLLGEQVGIEVASCGLIALRDGVLAYVVERFDRTRDEPPRKLSQFDFCQLLDLDPVDKYHHHAEKCFDVLRQHAANPERDTRRLFLWMLFSYWVGNGDLHLKNLALVGSESDGALRLSPAYDLVSTYLYGDEKMALYINGKERDLRRGDFHLLGEAGGLTRTEVDEVMTGMLSAQCVLLEIVGRSLLSEGLKESYRQLLRKRKRALLL